MQDPANRTPPVDTVFVYTPLNAFEAHHLCFSADLEPAKQAVEETMQACHQMETSSIISSSHPSMDVHRVL